MPKRKGRGRKETPMDEERVDATPQQYKQHRKERCETYEKASQVYESWDDERKRIRRRPAGHFDVIGYKKIA